jgi:hypothetical protein
MTFLVQLFVEPAKIEQKNKVHSFDYATQLSDSEFRINNNSPLTSASWLTQPLAHGKGPLCCWATGIDLLNASADQGS